ncbi:MAG: Pyruvate kinase [Candidatus Ozemobacter sibiricus]|uniref:Pyruvate kinase n=1 Tax=Candidatus Ozemobacter sibiricus TaxID=2268124 RepID=A0A367ZR93_9BACT|nr:MAG: Pyruvate kinase [Candidatus Ozemobacter sibiricus]
MGPASAEADRLRAMARVATRFRLNASHLSPDRLAWHLALIRDALEGTGLARPVVIDLQGAKVRVGQYPATSAVPQRVELHLAEVSDDPAIIPVPHEAVFAQTAVGDELHLNDRRVVLRVVGRSAADRLEAETLVVGPLAAGKGLNCPSRVYELPRVTARDAAAIEVGCRFPDVEFAVSFLLDGREGALFRPLIGGRRLIAKIERPPAFAALAAIDEAFDELWLCRGDLGAEVPLRDLGPWQSRFVASFPQLRKPRLLAGEVLGSMVQAALPTRSEIVHLHDIEAAGFDGIVLSDETAVGTQVPAVVRFLEDWLATTGE